MGFLDFIPIIGPIASAISQSEANETNVALAREQQEWSEKMWNLQNEYNTPKAALQRFKDAGINPNLLASQISGGYAGNPNMYQAAKVNPIISQDITQALAQTSALNQQSKHLDNETKLTNSQADYNFAAMLKELATSDNIKLNSKNMELINDYLERTLEDRVQNVGLQNEYLETQIKVGKKTYDQIVKNIDVMDKNIEMMDTSMQNQTKLAKAQIEKMQKDAYNGYLQACAALRNAAANEVNAAANFKNATTHERQVEIDKRYKEKLGEMLDSQIALNYQQWGQNDKKFDTELKILKTELLLKGEQLTYAEWQNTFNKITMPAQVLKSYGDASGVWQDNIQGGILFQQQFTRGLLQNFNMVGF